ncbi:MAG: hypothetical protein ACI9LO_001307 [Planctomycetota bacterium]
MADQSGATDSENTVFKTGAMMILTHLPGLPLQRLRATQGCLLLMLTIGIELPMQAATTTATVSANIVKPISLNTQSGLNFVDVSPNIFAGTVVLSPDGSRVATGGASIKSSVNGEAATFEVQGEPNAVYSISLPEAVLLTGSAGNNMLVDRFTSLPSSSGRISANGLQTLSVGARLNVGSNQAFGPYAGTMSVRIDYN